MRDLTQEEIDNAPSDFTHYFISDCGGNLAYAKEGYYYYPEHGVGRDSKIDLNKEAKPIPRKEFDIEKYKFDDEDIIETISYDDFIEIIPNHSIQELQIIKRDAIAIAKHFKLTMDDLK